MTNVLTRETLTEVARLEAERNRLLVEQAALDAEIRDVGERLAVAYSRDEAGIP